MIILAIDLGKFNSMCCFFDTHPAELTVAGMHAFLAYMAIERNVAKRSLDQLPIQGWRCPSR